MQQFIHFYSAINRQSWFVVLCLVLGMNSRAQTVTPVVGITSVTLCPEKTAILIFPYPVQSVDMGSADILVRPMQPGSPVLKIKAVKKDFHPTSLSVLTQDGKLYSFEVHYDSLPPKTVYQLGDGALVNTTPDSLMLPLGIAALEKEARIAAAQPSCKCYRAARKFRMLFRFRQVWYKSNLLFFVFDIHNYSSIPYDVHFARSYQRDKQHAKRSSQTEKELKPVYQYFSKGERINGHDSTTLVLVFDKFTMADHKKMVVELYEKDGDRVIEFPIKGHTILHAKTR